MIREAAKDHILLAAHRGVCGGNIPCNTLEAYQIALQQRADIVEIDVAITADKQLFVFHPGMEPSHLKHDKYLKDLPASEVEKLRFVNQDGTPTQCEIERLDDVLDLLKGHCFVNVDKFWTAIPEISECIRRHGMADQVIVKAPADPNYIDLLEQYAPDMPFMPLINQTDTITDDLLKRRINYIGAEVLFASETAQTATDEYIESMHEKRLLLWVNSIVYDYHVQLVAGHSDDIGIIGRMDESWGWLAQKHYDIIQTDWLLPMRLYFQSKGLKVK